MVKKKRYLGVLLGMLLLLLLLCPMMVWAAPKDTAPKVTTYTGGVWKRDASTGDKYYKVKKKKVTGWARIENQTYYFLKDGRMKTGWLKNHKGKDYFFEPQDQSGGMVTGFYRDQYDDLYYFDETGAAASGMFKVENKKYYASKTTHILVTKQWKKVRGTWYYFTGKGNCGNEWFTIGSKRYYCDPDVGKVFGWKKIKGKWYCFTEESYVLTSQWLEKGGKDVYVDSTGALVKTAGQTPSIMDYNRVILVGDSRFVYAKESHGINVPNGTFVAEKGKGLSWLATVGYPQIEAILKEEAMKQQTTPGKVALVCNLGVNDLEDRDIEASSLNLIINQYINYMINEIGPLAEKYNCDLYYVSVNPVNEKKLATSIHGMRTNKNIRTFNESIKGALTFSGYEYIDTYSVLMKRYSTAAMTTGDGLHYVAATSRVIFDEITMNLAPQR